MRYLVGGLEHEFYFPFHIWDVILPIDFHIFQDGWNHQPDILSICLLYLSENLSVYLSICLLICSFIYFLIYSLDYSSIHFFLVSLSLSLCYLSIIFYSYTRSSHAQHHDITIPARPTRTFRTAKLGIWWNNKCIREKQKNTSHSPKSTRAST
jgi:hypothetical protein